MPGVLTTRALVRVSSAGHPDDSDVSDAPFELVAPAIQLYHPSSVESWAVGTQHPIEWEDNVGNNIAEFTVDASSDGGLTWRPVPTAGATWEPRLQFFLPWKVTGPVTAHARIRITWSGGGLTTTTVSNEFSISSGIHVTSPNAAVVWPAGSLRTIGWTHNYGASQTFDVAFSPDAGATWFLLAPNVLAIDATHGSFAWTVPPQPTTQGLIRVSPSGQFSDGDNSDVPFTIVAFTRPGR